MSSIAVDSVALISILTGLATGIWLRRVLPPDHLSGDSKKTVMGGIGLVGTMTAMILGLLVASAKTAFDTQGTDLTRLSANAVVLDRILATYGPETKGARDFLRGTLLRFAELLESRSDPGPSELNPFSSDAELLYERIQELSPNDEMHRFLKGQALSQAMNIAQTRWLLYEQASSSAVPLPLLVTLVCWLAIIFASFGLFTPVNATTVGCMVVCALSVSIAIWLILEMYTPYGGLIRISTSPIHTALANLGH